MGKTEQSIIIKASLEQVWEMLGLDRWQEWQVGLASVFLDTKNMVFTSEVHTPEDKYRVGATAYSSKHREAPFEVTESIENEKITYKHYLLKEPANASTFTYVLEPVEDGTKLTHVIDTEFKSTLDKILMKMFGRLGERDLKTSLEKLKSILEQ